MPIDKAAVLRQIDDTLARFREADEKYSTPSASSR